MLTTTVRSLSPADLGGLQTLFGSNCPDHRVLGRELHRVDVYLWMGLFDGTALVAAHRAMLLGSRLLLKGVSVASSHRGTTAAWRLALAMKEAAAARGMAGLAAWIEPRQPERFLAVRLGIKESGPMVHRFQIPLPSVDEDLAIAASPPLAGELQVSHGTEPMVSDLLGRSAGSLNWVIDGRRIVLSGNPCAGTEELLNLLSTLRPMAIQAGAHAAEIALPASDLSAAFSILATGVGRLSRVPVRMGLLSLPKAEAALRRVVEVSA